jgi:hypothetical protein
VESGGDQTNLQGMEAIIMDPMNETASQTRTRMNAAHDVMAKAAALQASIFRLWEVQPTGDWDNKDEVDLALERTYHEANNLISQLLKATEVAYYG